MIRTHIRGVMLNIELKDKYHLLIPMLLSLVLVLIVTLLNNYPLSWDVYTHINYSLAYLHDGITSVDYLLNAPAGKTIGYPPMFHFLLIIVSFITHTSLVDGAKIIQILSVVFNVFAVGYVATKILDKKVGFFAAILLLSSFMFTRFLLPIPESLAVFLFIFAVYFYYMASTEADYRYSFLAAIFSVLILLTHISTFVYLMVLLVILALVQTFILKKLDAAEYYLYIVIPIFFMGILGLLALLVISPSHFGQIVKGMFSLIANPGNIFMGQIAMGLERYLRCVGIIPLAFSIIGLYYSFSKREYLFVSLWALVAFVITNLHWFGVPVYTFRLLLYLIVPMVILGAYGVVNIIDKIKTQEKQWVNIFVIALIILSFGVGLMHIMDDSVTHFSSTTEESTYQIAPPTSDEQEVIDYFKNENEHNKSILSNNLFFATVISSTDEIPVHYGFDVYTNKSLSKSSSASLHNEQIGYILYDKSLIMKNSTNNGRLDVRFVNGSYYPTYYFTKEINDNNFNTIKLPASQKTFENDRFIICKII